MKIIEIIRAIERRLPLWLQESWDNSGLQVGDTEADVTGVLLALDPTEEVIAQAIAQGCNLVITHHPLLFKGLKRVSTSTHIERTLRAAIRADITIYSAHTNADNAPEGLNAMLAEALGLRSATPLSLLEGSLSELRTYVPQTHLEVVQQALWQAGAGEIGSYDRCSFVTSGQGSFRPLEGANPYLGAVAELEHAQEESLTVVFPSGSRHAIVRALLRAHPYETPAYSIVSLTNEHPTAGTGMIGDLDSPIPLEELLRQVRSLFATDKLMYAGTSGRAVERVALCGGAGAFLTSTARRLGADVLITGEAKYNDYLDAESITLITVGHYESEIIAVDLFERIVRAVDCDLRIYRASADNNKIKTIHS